MRRHSAQCVVRQTVSGRLVDFLRSVTLVPELCFFADPPDWLDVAARPAICCASLIGGRASLLDAEYHQSLSAVFNTTRSSARGVHERLASTIAAQPTIHPLPVNCERCARIPIPTTTIPCLSRHTGNYASSTFVAASGADGRRAPVPSGLQQEACHLSSRPTVRPAPSTCLE